MTIVLIVVIERKTLPKGNMKKEYKSYKKFHFVRSCFVKNKLIPPSPGVSCKKYFDLKEITGRSRKCVQNTHL